MKPPKIGQGRRPDALAEQVVAISHVVRDHDRAPVQYSITTLGRVMKRYNGGPWFALEPAGEEPRAIGDRPAGPPIGLTRG